jgi:integral membrane protein
MLKTLRFLAITEGISYLLLAFTMLLKYVWKIPEPNYVVGMAHGVLFLLYCVYVVLCANKFKWNFGKTMILGLASLVPFGTFWADNKYLKN